MPNVQPVDATPTAGPPELARTGVVLPDDSLVAAMAELTLERARVELLGTQRTALDQSVQSLAAKLVGTRALRKHLWALRVDRAVATYRGESSGWRLGVIVHRSLAEERALYLVAAADSAARNDIEALDREAARLRDRLQVERSTRARVDKNLSDANNRLNQLLAKLRSANGAITTIDGELVFVPTGPSPIALLADAADAALYPAMLTQPPAANIRWLAARHALAVELTRSRGLEVKDHSAAAAAIERDWDLTPPSVLHAVLFALRQVGKEYVYATAGPDTFDCSGLTKAAYAQIRLGLPHFSGAQLQLGLPIPAGSLRPGDLLAYGPGGANHIAMYVGGGITVAAKGRAYGVIVAPARVDPAKGFAGATRVVP